MLLQNYRFQKISNLFSEYAIDSFNTKTIVGILTGNYRRYDTIKNIYI